MTTSARLDLRLNPTDKARISRAADLRGMPLSAFVRDAVLREADSVVMAAELTMTLSPEETRRFLAALDKPFKPNAKLKEAMEHGLTLAVRAAGATALPASVPTTQGIGSLATHLRGRATTRMSTDDIMKLTRNA